jgi:hypothetical protein
VDYYFGRVIPFATQIMERRVSFTTTPTAVLSIRLPHKDVSLATAMFGTHTRVVQFSEVYLARGGKPSFKSINMSDPAAGFLPNVLQSIQASMTQQMAGALGLK